jgi:hypothetical protein
MNTPLRRRHAAWITALALVLPIAFAAAIATRQAPAVARELALEPRAANSPEPLVVGQGELSLLQRANGPRWQARHDATRITIAQLDGAEAPDLLAYWTFHDAGGDELSSDAVLLGPIDGGERTFARPGAGGVLVLFSLAHGEVIARATLELR